MRASEWISPPRSSTCWPRSWHPGRVFGREELLDLVWGEDGFVEPGPWTCTWPGSGEVHDGPLPAPGIETCAASGIASGSRTRRGSAAELTRT